MSEIKLVLKEKQRDDLSSLLEDHQKVADALLYVDRVSWTSVMTVMHPDDNDHVECTLHHTIARKALVAHKEWIENELKKLGVGIT